MFLISFEVCVVTEVIQIRHYGGIAELVLFLKGKYFNISRKSCIPCSQGHFDYHLNYLQHDICGVT